MEQTTQSPPATEKSGADNSAAPAANGSQTTPLPSTEKDFQRSPRARDGAAFREQDGVLAQQLLVAAFCVYRHVSSYENTDRAQVDGYINSISGSTSGHVTKRNVLDNP